MKTSDNKFTYEIINSFGVISEKQKGWKLEFNRVSWNGAEPKYDVRTWNGTHDIIGKGIALTEEELRTLAELINKEIKYLDE